MAERIPRFINSHTNIRALGLAVDRNSEVFYLSGVGPANSVTSIHRSLFSRAEQTRKVQCQDWRGYRSFGVDQKNYMTHQVKLPNTSEVHMSVTVEHPDLLLAIDPRGYGLEFRQRQALLKDQWDTFMLRFSIWLRQNVDIPTKPEWTESIWTIFQDYWDDDTGQEPFQRIESHGTCIFATKVNREFPWNTRIARLIEKGALTF